jgi:hypothetical protein
MPHLQRKVGFMMFIISNWYLLAAVVVCSSICILLIVQNAQRKKLQLGTVLLALLVFAISVSNAYFYRTLTFTEAMGKGYFADTAIVSHLDNLSYRRAFNQKIATLREREHIYYN